MGQTQVLNVSPFIKKSIFFPNRFLLHGSSNLPFFGHRFFGNDIQNTTHRIGTMCNPHRTFNNFNPLDVI